MSIVVADDVDKPSPQVSASFLSQLFLAWFDKTVWKAWYKPIEEEDVWDLNTEDSCRSIIPLWEGLWQEELDQGKQPGIFRIIFKAFYWDIIRGACWQFSYLMIQFIGPQILGLVIAFVQNPNEPNWKGYSYAVMLGAVGIAAAVCDSKYWYNLSMIGLRIRTAISSAVYKKTLTLSSVAKRDQTAGEVVNLLSVDCQKLQDAVVFLNLMWSCPLQVGLAIYFLYEVIGWSVFVGLGILLITLPLNAFVWAVLEKYQTTQMKLKDSRVRVITEIMAGVKVLKLFCWEDSFIQKIGKCSYIFHNQVVP